MRVERETPIGLPRAASERQESCDNRPSSASIERVFGIGLDVGDVDGVAFEQRAPERRPRSGSSGIFLTINELGREAIARRTVETPFFSARNDGLIGLAEASGRFDECLQYRLQIESRAADDLEHVGGGGLLLQRFAQLVEQPRILDGDDGLGGEVLDQLNLLVGERLDLIAGRYEDADRRSFSQQRDTKIVRRPPSQLAPCDSRIRGRPARQGCERPYLLVRTRPVTVAAIRPNRMLLSRMLQTSGENADSRGESIKSVIAR